jgi:hypothetical protein
MIHDDKEVGLIQERMVLFERTLAEARKNYSASNYRAMADGYLSEIDRLHAEIREYSSTVANPGEAP